LYGDGGERELELQRRRALEFQAGTAATHLDPKRIAADRLRRAVLRPAGTPLGLAPRGQLGLGTGRRIEPNNAPACRQHHHECEWHKQQPAPAARNGR